MLGVFRLARGVSRGPLCVPTRVGQTKVACALRSPAFRQLRSQPRDRPPTLRLRDYASLAGVGGSAGAFGSLVGVGGGIFVVPMLTSFLRMSQHQAQATSLATVASTGLSGATTYALNGSVDPQVAAVVSIMAMVTTRLGVRVSQNMDGKVLKRVMGFFILAIAPVVPLKTYLTGSPTDKVPSAAGESSPESAVEGAEEEKAAAGGAPAVPTLQRFHAKLFRPESVKETVSAVVIGACAGMASGMFGIGGGLLVTPSLSIVLDVPQQLVLGTTLAAMVPPALLGTFYHYRLGNLVPRAVPVLVIGSLTGAALGSELALDLADDTLRWIFTVAMVGMGARMAM